jgi:kelch-like protein 10
MFDLHPRLEATDMGIIRSALTANVVAGLPNVREYIHKDRDRLMEDRRLRILHQQSRDSLEHLGSDEDLIEVD